MLAPELKVASLPCIDPSRQSKWAGTPRQTNVAEQISSCPMFITISQGFHSLCLPLLAFAFPSRLVAVPIDAVVGITLHILVLARG